MKPVPGTLPLVKKEYSRLREEDLAGEEDGDTSSQRVIKKVFRSGQY